jgi:hypothetical protein
MNDVTLLMFQADHILVLFDRPKYLGRATFNNILDCTQSMVYFWWID